MPTGRARQEREGGTCHPDRMSLSAVRSAWWDERLYNWALWKRGANSLGSSASDGYYGGDDTRPPPPLVGEAFDTDRLIRQLPTDQQQALEAVYVWSIGTLDERAAALGIHRNTLRNRVDAAKGGVDALWWQRKGAMARA